MTVETEMAVLAEDERKAEDVARKHIRDLDSYDFSVHGTELTDLKFCDPDIRESPPYGDDGIKTVNEWMEEVRDAKAALNQQELKL